MTSDPKEPTTPDNTTEDDTTVETVEPSEDVQGLNDADQGDVGEVKEPESPEDELEKWRNLAHRNQAELENFRKRMARDKMDAIQYSNLGLLEELLPIIDNFEMGLIAAKDASEESVIFQGMSMVLKQMQNFLAEHGVEPIESLNQNFDPNLHEAMEQRYDDEVPEGNVIQEIRRGYKCKDRLLRASNVVVSKGPESASE